MLSITISGVNVEMELNNNDYINAGEDATEEATRFTTVSNYISAISSVVGIQLQSSSLQTSPTEGTSPCGPLKKRLKVLNNSFIMQTELPPGGEPTSPSSMEVRVVGTTSSKE